MNAWEKKSRTLTKALIISGGLNIAFLSTFIVLALRPTTPQKIAFNAPREERVSNTRVFHEYLLASFEELTFELKRNEQLEKGYCRRDLALACLVAFHDFDIKRALPSDELQTRSLHFTNPQGGEELELTLYPSLNSAHFDTLQAFAQTEQWPLTPKGLFEELKRGNNSSSLKETFYLTPEFYALTMLFNRSKYLIEKQTLLSMILHCDFQDLPKAFENFDASTRRALLQTYVNRGSPIAARLLVETEKNYVQNRLDNEKISILIPLLTIPTNETVDFLKETMIGLRPDSVREMAAKQLCKLTNQSLPEPYEHSIVVKLFFPDAPTEKKVHFIKKGDTLWDLARHYKTTVSALREANDLPKDKALRLGKTLVIP
ncbi:MAG: hypothetical protein SP1CHLAM54_01360 [Chlamydiia bacterium]|nr:hypothetical protein [Chlamydiia bacterium]MCH9615057.1 hypothetical protein [Chlamydiia bacterium]MCH9629892.1 hypothetical protein [Chlamydiia bacterium]